VGAIELVACLIASLALCGRDQSRFGGSALYLPPFRGSVARSGVLLKLVIWLILPVVICLSQRLSHACLSISNYTVKLRMAHYISYRLFEDLLLHG
jgi:hypothetical protein